jgi:trehalose 6-phosphate synthase
VAKEYVACRTDLDGALVLSRYAGAADEMREAFLVDPFDEEALRDALLAALRAERPERRLRMEQLRKGLVANDAHRWGTEFLDQLGASRRAA